jgi:hypothetical protein
MMALTFDNNTGHPQSPNAAVVSFFQLVSAAGYKAGNSTAAAGRDTQRLFHYYGFHKCHVWKD